MSMHDNYKIGVKILVCVLSVAGAMTLHQLAQERADLINAKQVKIQTAGVPVSPYRDIVGTDYACLNNWLMYQRRGDVAPVYVRDENFNPVKCPPNN